MKFIPSGIMLLVCFGVAVFATMVLGLIAIFTPEGNLQRVVEDHM